MLLTRESQIRAEFWRQHPNLSRKRIPDGKTWDYPVDTRVAFVDWTDWLERSGYISRSLSFRVTLRP